MKWIKVEDELPEEGVRVLTIDRWEKYLYEYRIDYVVKFPSEPSGFIWACRLQDDQNKVNYWMPLPLPPRAQ